VIERLDIHNWQSLRSVELELGRLTVIVGPSSSGKTALMRAVRALASNVRGAGSITRGQKACAVTARTGEQQITLERSETAGCYRLVDLASGQERTYTKLAGAVPEPVTAALGIDPIPTNGTSLHFAGQFDRPYLLDDSGATVARVLGELTNVTRLFDAVREANRRRNAQAATLRVREADLADLQQRAAAFASHPHRLAVCDRAEQLADHTQTLAGRVERLRVALSTLDIADAALARTEHPAPVPTDDAVQAAAGRLASYRTLVRTWVSANHAITAATAAVQQTTQAEADGHHQLHAALQAAGTCPTCGRPTG
jgi:exonuclease SbcC